MNGVTMRREFPVGPLSGLVLALSNPIYSIVGRFGMPKHREHARAAWTQMRMLFEANLKAMSLISSDDTYHPLFRDWKVVCDASVNTSELVDQSKICLLLMADKRGIASEFYICKPVFARVEIEGRGHLEIEWLPCGN